MIRFARFAAAAAAVAALSPAALAQAYPSYGQELTPEQLQAVIAEFEAAMAASASGAYADPYAAGFAQGFSQSMGQPGYAATPNPYAQGAPQGYGYGQPQMGGAGADGVAGSRVFWVTSASLFSSAGGASGYVHLCPGGVLRTSSESSVSVGGDYNSQTMRNNDWAGAAGVSQGGGRWAVENSQDGPVVALYFADGSTGSYALSNVQSGSWSWGRTRYAVERGQASCY